MKNLFLGFSLIICSAALFSFTAEKEVAAEVVVPETFIIDEADNIFHIRDGHDCLIDLGTGEVYGDCGPAPY